MTVGVDLIEIERIRRALARYPSFRERCFTEAERAYCDSRPNPPSTTPPASPARRRSARRSASGSHGRSPGGTSRSPAGPKPDVRVSGRVAAWAERVGAESLDLSMTHSRELAAAVCVVDGSVGA